MGKPVRVNVVCRVRVPRILIVLKGSQHGTHERYYLIYQGMGSSARALESTLGHTLWPRVARPPPRSRDSASSTAASPRSAKKARHRPASSAASSAAAAIANTIAPPPSAAPRAARPHPACTRRSSAKRRSARPRTRRARATRGDRFKDAAARHGTSSRAERELVPLQRRRRAHGHDQRPAADVQARRTLPRCALTCTRPSVRCRTGTEVSIVAE